MINEAQMREAFKDRIAFEEALKNSKHWPTVHDAFVMYMGWKLALSALPRMTEVEISRTIVSELHGDSSGIDEGVRSLIAKLPHIVKEQAHDQ